MKENKATKLLYINIAQNSKISTNVKIGSNRGQQHMNIQKQYYTPFLHINIVLTTVKGD